MVIRNRLFAFLFRVASFGVSVWSCYLLFATRPPAIALCYFTVQTNILIAGVFALLVLFNLIDLIKHGLHGVAAGLWMPFALAGLLYALMTAIVGNGFLSQSPYTLTTVLAHIVTPALYLLDWMLFEEKGTVKWWHAFYWLVFPAFYGAFIFIRPTIWPDVIVDTKNNSMYPYYFIDVTKNGAQQVSINVAILAAAFFVLGLVIVFFNNLMGGRFKKRTPSLKV